MDGIEEKADEMLRSPLGCAFLLAAAASELPPEEIAAAPNRTYFAAFARRDIEVRQNDYQAIRDEILRQGQQHRDLALSILEQPEAGSWFGPLDRDRQAYVPYGQERRPPEPGMFKPLPSPLSRAEQYSEMWFGGMLTSTLAGGTAGWFAGLDLGFGDMHLPKRHESPYECWFLRADPSARVFEIDGPQAWHDLCVRYHAVGSIHVQTPDFSGDAGRLVPDWAAIAEDWDAVHLTFGGLLTAHQVRVESGAGWTYMWTWDVEQTQWLRWMFSFVERLPDHEKVRKTLLDGLFHPMFVARADFYGASKRVPEDPVDFPPLQPPPTEPPDVYLIRRGSSYERQQGRLGATDWTVDGQTVSTRPEGRKWPPAVEISDSDTVAVKMATQSAPATIEIRLYERLGPDGVPVGDPSLRGGWRHPGAYSRNAEAHAKVLTYNAEDEPPGWEFTLNIPASSDEWFITIWAFWIDAYIGPGTYSANWMLSVRRPAEAP